MAARHRTRQRPKRGGGGDHSGDRNILVAGDSGTYAGPQGGGPGIIEEGDLAAREFGVPQADIPGGKLHVVNPETIPARTEAPPTRPSDLHKFHGVEPLDLGHYVTPPDATQDIKHPPGSPVEDDLGPVPVYVVQGPDEHRVLRETSFDSIRVNSSAAPATPTRLANADPNRVDFRVLNEDTANDVRIGARDDLAQGRGALLSHFCNSYTSFPTQDEVFALGTSGNTVLVSVIQVTEIPAVF